MLTKYDTKCLEHVVGRLNLTDVSDLVDHKYFTKQIFLGAGDRNDSRLDFSGQAMAVLRLKLQEALFIISGMQQGPITESVFDKEQSKRLNDIIEQINIALKGKGSEPCPRCEAALQSAKNHLEAFQAREAEREIARNSFP